MDASERVSPEHMCMQNMFDKAVQTNKMFNDV